MIRTDAGSSVSMFAELGGVPGRTYHARPLAPTYCRRGKGALGGGGGGSHQARRGQVRGGVAGVGLSQDRDDRRRGGLGRGLCPQRQAGYVTPRAYAVGALPGRAPPVRRYAFV